MSSIYKKGRDGYYYYQTYIYNPETGKKDKRIYHSLKTKSIDEAKKKKKDYDSIYDNKNKRHKKSRNLLLIVKKSIPFLITAIITITVMPYLNTPNQNAMKHVPKKFEEKRTDSNSNDSLQMNITSDLIKGDTIKIIGKIEENNKVFDKSYDSTKIIIPNYKVISDKIISGSFNQGEIHAIVNGKYSMEGLKFLSRKIKSKYSNYTNVIICIYKDNKSVSSLSELKKYDIDSDVDKILWLSMYTFNSVEGEYFDSNPSRLNNRHNSR